MTEDLGEGMQAGPETSSRRGLIIGIVVVVLLLCCCLTVVLAYAFGDRVLEAISGLGSFFTLKAGLI